jgi:regulator of sigma E protease
MGDARTFMLTLLAFLFAIGLLVTVHEYGHYRVARALGVRVLRFSIGFGPALLRWSRGGTEFVVAALPLGGFVRMVDEREGPVPAADLPRAFNRQSPLRRAAIVGAGPAANLLLAALLFTVLALAGQREPLPLLAQPAPGSAAARAGVQAGDLVLALGGAHGARAVQSWGDLAAALDDATPGALELQLRRGDASRVALVLNPGRAAATPVALGLRLLAAPVRITQVLPGQPAAQAGLLAGDVVVAVAGAPLRDPGDLLQAIQHSGGRALALHLRRGAGGLDVQVRPRWQDGEARQPAGWRIGALLGAEVPSLVVRRAPLAALRQGFGRTWALSGLTLRTLGATVVGRASLDNLSGPVTIADYAGRSAALGWQAYLGFLAVVSVSLGVLNLLPLPVLDGGHLLYYAVEVVTRRSVPLHVQERLQQGGLALILLVMALALYNDFARLIGPFH